MPERGIGGVFRVREGDAHLVGIAAAGLDLERAAGDLAHDLVVLGGFARTGMEADAHAVFRAHVPLRLDEFAQARIVGIRRIFLEAESGGNEIDRHAHHFTEREHDGGGLGRGQAGQFIDREFAQVSAARLGSERGGASGGVFLVATLHLQHRRPDGAEQFAKSGIVELDAGGGDASAGLGDDVSGNRAELRRLVEGKFRREIEGNVTGQQAAGHERVFPAVEFAADGLVVGVERPGDPAVMETGLQLRKHAAVAHALDTLTLMPLGYVGADERERHGVEPVVQHRIDVVHQFAGNGILIGGQPDLQRAHGPLDSRPVQGRETRADAERTAAELGSRGREDRRGSVALLDEILEFEQIRPGGGKHRGRPNRNAAGKRLGDGMQFPGAIARGIFQQRELTGRGGEAALGEFFGLASADVGQQRVPIETEVGADTGILCNAQVVFEEELIDGGHERERRVTTKHTKYTKTESEGSSFRVFRG